MFVGLWTEIGCKTGMLSRIVTDVYVDLLVGVGVSDGSCCMYCR